MKKEGKKGTWKNKGQGRGRFGKVTYFCCKNKGNKILSFVFVRCPKSKVIRKRKELGIFP